MALPKIRLLFLSTLLIAFTACSTNGGEGFYNKNSSSSSSSSSNSSNSSGTGSSSSGSVGSTTRSVSISGLASKGIIKGGLVTFYKTTSDSLFATRIGNTVTDVNGAYQFEIENYQNDPVTIRVSAAEDGSTSMSCDLRTGCGADIDFGDELSLSDSNFTLDVVIPPIEGDQVSANINILTHTAAAVIAKELSSASTISLIDTIHTANRRLANRFGIIEDITQIPLIDITDPNAIASADSSVLNFNVLGTAIVAATKNDNANADSVESAVQAFAQQYANDGGIADKEALSSPSVSYIEVLQQAGLLISILSDASDSSREPPASLSALSTKITATTLSLNDRGSTTPEDGTANAVGITSELDTVKAMIDDLRNLGTGLDMSKAESFEAEIDIAKQSFDEDSSSVFKAFAKASGIMTKAWNAYQEDNTLTLFTDDNTQTQVTITSTQTQISYNITGDLLVESGSVQSAVAVNVTAVDRLSHHTVWDLSETEQANALFRKETAKLELELTGISQSSKVLLTVTEGTFRADAQRIGSFLKAEAVSGETEELIVSNAIFILEIELKESASTGTITFDGGIRIEFDNLVVEDRYARKSLIENDSRSLASGVISMAVFGEFFSSTGENLKAALAIEGSDRGFNYVCANYANISETGEKTWEGETCTNNTRTQDFRATLVLELDVAGISDDIDATFSWSGTSDDEQTTTLKLKYADKIFDATYSKRNELDSLSIINQAGVKLNITENDSVKSTVTYNDTEYAHITNQNGFVEIVYTDGTHVSF